MKIKKTFKKSISIILSILMIISTLMVAITSVSAWSINNGVFFFVKPSGWTNAHLAIGGDPNSNKHRQMYAPTNNIDNVYVFTGINWSNYKSFFFVDVDWTCNSESGSFEDWKNENPDKSTDYIDGDTSGYLYKLNSGNKGAISATPYANTTHTVSASVYVKDSSGNLTANSSIGTASVSGHYFSSTGSKITSSSKVTKYTSATFTTSLNSTYKSAYKFVGWYNGSSLISGATSTSYSVNSVTSNLTYKAVYEPITHAVTASVTGGGGTVSPTSQSINHGSNANITITPNDGYELATIKDNSISQSLPTKNSDGKTYTYKITNVIATHNVVVTFKRITHSITLSKTGNGKVLLNDSETTFPATVNQGGSITLKAVPDDGWRIKTFTVGGSPVEGDTYTGTMGTSNLNVNVVFEKITHNVTINTTGNGTALVNGAASASIAEGETFNVVVTPEPGYCVKSFKVDNVETEMESSGGTYSGTMGNADITIEVEFAPEKTYQLTVDIDNSSENGSITYNDQTVTGDLTINATLAEGESITITFTPNRKYQVTSLRLNDTDVTQNISGDTRDECTYTVTSSDLNDGDNTLHVTFGEITEFRHYRVDIAPAAHGTVTAKYNSITVGEGSYTSVTEDDYITLTAVPEDDNYVFVQYQDEHGNQIITEGNGVFYPTSDITITGIFNASGMELNDVEIWVKGTTLSTYAINCAIDGETKKVERVTDSEGYIGTYITGAYRFYWYKINVGTIRVGEAHEVKLTTAKSKMNAMGIVNFENCDEDNKRVYLAVDNMVNGTEFTDITDNENARKSFRSVQNMISNEQSYDPLDKTMARTNISLLNEDGSVSYETYMFGDVDCNDDLNVKDATNIQLYLAGLANNTENMEILGDFDIDGNVNILDVTKIQLFLAGLAY